MDKTDNQAAFISALVLEGCNPTEAARRAGYAQPKQRAYELLRKPHIIDAIRQEQERLLSGELTNVAMATLRQIMENENCTPAARVAASRAVLEAAGMFKKPPLSGRERQTSLAEMSREELQSMLSHLQAQYAEQQAVALHGIGQA